MNDPVFRNVRFLPGTIHAGFPSPASDYEERELDINDLVVPHQTTSYFMRVSGDSMSRENWRGIYPQTATDHATQENISQT